MTEDVSHLSEAELDEALGRPLIDRLVSLYVDEPERLYEALERKEELEEEALQATRLALAHLAGFIRRREKAATSGILGLGYVAGDPHPRRVIPEEEAAAEIRESVRAERGRLLAGRDAHEARQALEVFKEESDRGPIDPPLTYTGRPLFDLRAFLATRCRDRGIDFDWLIAPAPRGRPSPETTKRLDTLAELCMIARRRHATLEQIGAAIGRSKQDVARLLTRLERDRLNATFAPLG